MLNINDDSIRSTVFKAFATFLLSAPLIAQGAPSTSVVDGQITSTNIQESRLLTAAEKHLLEATKEAQKVQEEFNKTVAELESLHLPIASKTYDYSSGYGGRCAPVPGAGDFHSGMDLAAPYGTPILSIAAGEVTKVVDGVINGVGGSVVVSSTINGQKVDLLYHHMEVSSKFVKVGDTVVPGQQISEVSSTGMSTGPHLHLEVWIGGVNGDSVDPSTFFQILGLDIAGNARSDSVTGTPPSVCTGTPPERALISEPVAPPLITEPTPTTPEVTPPVTSPPVAPPVTEEPQKEEPKVTEPPKVTTPPPVTEEPQRNSEGS